MSNIKQYTITINGIKESADAVDTLNKQLDALEQRIDELNKKGVSVSKAMGGNTSDMTAEQKLAEQINQSYEKRLAMQTELGKELANEKALMKEINAEAKAAAASERLSQGGYASNTMLGMKQELADIKMAMQTMDMGSAEFEQATQRALDLTNQLKSAEEAYGTFSRNVGNYSNDILNAFKQITVKVGETELKFNSTKEAIRSMEQAMTGLANQGKQDTEEYKALSNAIHYISEASRQAKNDIDAMKASSEGIHNMIENMQSFAAVGNISGGFSNLFGIGGDFQQSVQKLMSLQSVLQGLKTISDQMSSGGGLGKYFGSASNSIDEFSAKLLRVKGGMEGLSSASKATSIAVKGLSTVMKGLAGVGIGLLVEGAMKLAEKVGNLISGWLGGNEEIIDSNKIVADSIDLENRKLEEEEKQLKKNYELGKLSAQDLFNEKAKAKAESIERLLDDYDRWVAADDDLTGRMRENLQKGIRPGEGVGMKRYNTPRIEIATDEEGLKEFNFLLDANNDRLTIWEEKAKQGIDTSKEFAQGWREMSTTLEDTSTELKYVGAVAEGEFMNRLKHAMQTVKVDVNSGMTELNNLLELLQKNDWYATALNHPENIINKDGFIKIINEIMKRVYDFKNEIDSISPYDLEQLEIDAMKDGTEKRIAQENLRYKKEKEQWAGHEKQKVSDKEDAMTVEEAMEKKHQNNLLKAQQTGGAARVKTAKATAKQTLDVEKESKRLEIELMAEGLNKRIAQLNRQRDEELSKVKGHKELEAKINKLYDKKILDERKKWADEMEKTYAQLYANILDMTIKNLQSQLDYADETLDKELKKRYDRRAIQNFASPFSVLTANLTKEQEEYVAKLTALLKEDMQMADKLMKLWNNGFDATELEQEREKVTKELYKMKEAFADTKISDTLGLDFDRLREFIQNFDKTFDETTEDFKTFVQRTNNFWELYIKTIKDNIDTEFRTRVQLSNKNREKEETDNEQWRKEQIEAAKKYYGDLEQDESRSEEQRKKDAKEFTATIKNINEQFRTQDIEIDKKYQRERDELQKEHNTKINEQVKEANKQRINDAINALQRYSQMVNEYSQTQPVQNAWGLTNWSATNKILRESLDGLKLLKTQAMATREELRKMWDDGVITTDEYNDKMADLRNILEGVDDKIKEISGDLTLSHRIETFFNEIQQYYSAVVSAVQQVWGELDNLANYELDRQQDYLDKQNEILQDKLDAQEEILERHKERVDDIEGKLQDARGDRKEALIDALNAEIIAQRRAQAEKERLEKEQEKLEERQKDLDYQRQLNEFNSGLRQILFNTASAVMQAANNHWPTPAVPLMALAAAAGGAQYAIALQQRPIKKAEGGLLEGASHANGGIPVGMTGIEVEGGEYVIRKSSTNENIELLDFINNSRRKLYADDLINFFRNDRQRFIANTAKTRFADGGILDIADNSSFNLGSAFAAYSDRPIVVSVVDINERQADVRNVEVLAGLTR